MMFLCFLFYILNARSIELKQTIWATPKHGYHHIIEMDLVLSPYDAEKEHCQIVSHEIFDHQFYLNPYELNTLHEQKGKPKRYFDPSIFPEMEHVHLKNDSQIVSLLSVFNVTKQTVEKKNFETFIYHSELPIHIRYQRSKECNDKIRPYEPIILTPYPLFYSRCTSVKNALDDSSFEEGVTLQSLLPSNSSFFTFKKDTSKYYLQHSEAAALSDLLQSKGWKILEDNNVKLSGVKESERSSSFYPTTTLRLPVGDVSDMKTVSFMTIATLFVSVVVVLFLLFDRSHV